MGAFCNMLGPQNTAAVDAFGDRNQLPGHDLLATQPQTPPVAPLVDFAMGPEEEPSGSYGACSPWSLLHAWSSHHGVDDDLGLLLCANTAANVAGPSLEFEGGKYMGHIPIPTVISTAEDTGFHKAAKAAIESLYQIQHELVAKYGGLSEAPVPKKRRRRSPEELAAAFRESFMEQYAQFLPGYHNPAKDMDPAKQRCGPVLFVLEGTLPAKPLKFLKTCHLYSALSVAEVEELPHSDRSREIRLRKISSMIAGHLNGKVSIRGFMRFASGDLEWMVKNCRYLMINLLPVESLVDGTPDPLESKAGERQEFDRLHRTALRRILELRFSRKDCAIGLNSGEADRRFRILREGYRAEACAVSHKNSVSLILPDLFVWYLLHLNKSDWLQIDEMEIVEHAFAVSRRLRRRVAVFYDRHIAILRARQRMALATKLVARMQRLARPCTRRDLARGLDNQGMDVIGPVIDLLVALGVFSKTRKTLSLPADMDTLSLKVDDFMEPLTDVPFSLIRRLEQTEAYQAQLANTSTELTN